jgi:hypothetical protein
MLGPAARILHFICRKGKMQERHFYDYGEVYETLETCDELELHLSRLKRKRILNEEEWLQSKREISEIRAPLERRLQYAQPGTSDLP